MAEAMRDAQYMAVLGAKCPECGWRSTEDRPNHRPLFAAFGPCSRWSPTADGVVEEAATDVEVETAN